MIMLPPILFSLLPSLLNWFSYEDVPDINLSAVENPSLQFTLRHLHALTPTSHVVFKDVPGISTSLHTPKSYSQGEPIRTRRIRTSRPSSHEMFMDARQRSMRLQETTALDWDEDDVVAPDVTKRETLLLLAKMTSNAYYPEPGTPGWYDLGERWNVSYPFGWEPDQDGFRGYIFATEDNSTVILSIKGTTVPWIGDGWTWTPVCDCPRGGYKCDQVCLEETLMEDSLFYNVATNLYYNVTYMYPNASIWLIGHSLGGSLAALLGATFGVPVVAFETPGEKLAASRLHLPSPRSVQHITHVYHTADPVAMGTCNGISTCATFGFAFETKCHQGVSIIYDTVSNLSWSVNIAKHGIVTVIESVLNKTWLPSEEMGLEVPIAYPEEDCIECFSWEFGDFPRNTSFIGENGSG